MLKRLEGVRYGVYLDASGFPTIGVGHLLTQSERASGKIRIGRKPVEYADGLSQDDVEALLTQDLEVIEDCVWKNTTELEEHEFDALVIFAFNVGCEAFRRSTLVKKIAAGKKNEVPIQLARWVWSAGRMVEGLRHRREEEIALWKQEPA